MKKIILTFGLIAGIIVAALFCVTHGGDIDFDKGMVYGYLSMVIALSTIFFATKQYRDKYNEGQINFAKSFKIGIGITIVATIVYILFWEVYIKYFAFDFPDKYIAYMTETLASEGKSMTEIESTLAPTRDMMATYTSNIFYRMAITATEIFPVGLIITLISSIIFRLILKNKSSNSIPMSTS